MIWSGMGVLLSKATEELQELAELTEIPVYCTMRASRPSTTAILWRWSRSSATRYRRGPGFRSRTCYLRLVPA